MAFVKTTPNNEQLTRYWSTDHIIYLRDAHWMGDSYNHYQVILSNGHVESVDKEEFEQLLNALQL